MIEYNIYRCTKPCDDCPFVDRHKLHISENRINEIKAQLDSGLSFNCHKTVYPEVFGKEHDVGLKMCWGAWKYVKDTNNPNQQMQVAERLGIE